MGLTVGGTFAIEVERLSKTYEGKVTAVEDVSFRVSEGEVFGLLGPNGAGKTTTIRMLAGLLEPTDGEILFEGTNIKKDLFAYKRRLGYVPDMRTNPTRS